jgi:hypothetical protein
MRSGIHKGFRWESKKQRDNWEDLVVDGKVILRWVLGKYGMDGMDWFDSAQDTEKCRTLLNMVINHWVL